MASPLRWVFGTVGTLFLVVSTAVAQPIDYAEYQRLSERANTLLENVWEASPAAVRGVREAAVRADLDVIEWLDTFLASDVFGQLPAAQQQAVISDRYRWEYNLSVQLIALERCQEASERIEALFETAIDDAELQPQLSASFDDALACVTRLAEPPPTQVTVRSSTPGTEVLIDGQYIGPAPVELELAPGAHVATLRAEGYELREVAFEAVGAATIVGPVELRPVVTREPEPERRPPNALEWTLWSVGVAGVGSFTGLFITARNRENTVESNPGRVLDPVHEQGIIDRLDTAAYILGGVGLASAIVGTVLYLVGRDAPQAPPETDTPDEDVALVPTVGGVLLRVSF